MMQTDVIRAWKDPFYRASLPEGILADLPAHPSGLLELDDEQLMTSSGLVAMTTAPTCTAYTFLGWAACCPAPTTAPNCTVYTFGSLKGCCPSTD